MGARRLGTSIATLVALAVTASGATAVGTPAPSPAATGDGQWSHQDLDEVLHHFPDDPVTAADGTVFLPAFSWVDIGCNGCDDHDDGRLLEQRDGSWRSHDLTHDGEFSIATTGNGDVVDIHDGSFRIYHDGTWSDDQPLPTGYDGTAGDFGNADTDSGGNAYLWWWNRELDEYRLGRFVDGSWSEPVDVPVPADHVLETVVPSPDGLHAISVLRNVEDRHVIYEDLTHSVLTEEGWSAPTPVFDESFLPSREVGRFMVAPGVGGLPVVIASTHRERPARLVVSQLGADGWSASTIARSRNLRSFGLATGPAGQHVAWATGPRVRTSRRTPGGWSTPRTLGRFEEPNGVELVSDSRGNLTALWSIGARPTAYQVAQRPLGGQWALTRRLRPPDHRRTSLSRTWTLADGRVLAPMLVGPVDEADDYSSVRFFEFDPPGLLTRASTSERPRSTRIRVGWRTTWGRAESHDVRFRQATSREDFSAWSTWRQQTERDHATLSGTPGRTYCFQARAYDGTGAGSWSTQRCATTAVDDAGLARRGHWRGTHRSRDYRHTLTVGRQRGARLVLRGVRAQSVALLASTSRRGGAVRVTFAGRNLGRVSLATHRSRARKVIPVDGFSRVRSGRLVITVVSSGRPVRLDGVFLSARS